MKSNAEWLTSRLLLIWQLEESEARDWMNGQGLALSGTFESHTVEIECPSVLHTTDWVVRLSSPKEAAYFYESRYKLTWTLKDGFHCHTSKKVNEAEANEGVQAVRVFGGEEISLFHLFRRNVWLSGCPVEEDSATKTQWFHHGLKLGLRHNYLRSLNR